MYFGWYFSVWYFFGINSLFFAYDWCWYVVDCWILVSFFCFGLVFWILCYDNYIMDYGCWILLSSYDDKKGEKWMFCERRSYSEIINLAFKNFLFNEWGGVYTHMLNLFLSSIHCFIIIKKGGECWHWSLTFDVYKTNGWY